MKSLIAAIAISATLVSLAPAHSAETKPVVIDVRTPEEFSGPHVDGALNIDVQSKDFVERIQKLDKSKTYKIYCRSGRRSGLALEKMKTLGFKDVENLGGVDDAKAKLAK